LSPLLHYSITGGGWANAAWLAFCNAVPATRTAIEKGSMFGL